jgi:hypothetical protein
MQPIRYRGRLAALAGEVVAFAPHIGALEPDHPERRFVSAMSVYACEVEQGLRAAPYDQEAAGRYARALLMPAEEFGQVAHWPDAELAELFGSPLDEVAARRRDPRASAGDRRRGRQAGRLPAGPRRRVLWMWRPATVFNIWPRSHSIEDQEGDGIRLGSAPGDATAVPRVNRGGCLPKPAGSQVAHRSAAAARPFGEHRAS